jgi:hypothetical protein
MSKGLSASRSDALARVTRHCVQKKAAFGPKLNAAATPIQLEAALGNWSDQFICDE